MLSLSNHRVELFVKGRFGEKKAEKASFLLSSYRLGYLPAFSALATLLLEEHLASEVSAEQVIEEGITRGCGECLMLKDSLSSLSSKHGNVALLYQAAAVGNIDASEQLALRFERSGGTLRFIKERFFWTSYAFLTLCDGIVTLPEFARWEFWVGKALFWNVPEEALWSAAAAVIR
jgi:hypothetical protein